MINKGIKIPLCVVLVLLLACLPGCWSAHEVNTLAISVGIGIDKSEQGYLITEQIVNPKAFAAKTPSDEPRVVLYSAEGENLETTMKSLAAQTSRIMLSSHLRLVVLSEEIAREGVKDILEYFTRSHEYRTDFLFVIARGLSAKELLSVPASIESIPAVELYELLTQASSEWASVKTIKLVELINSIAAEGSSPVMPGVEVIRDVGGETGGTNSISSSKQPYGGDRFHYAGLGVFSKDKLVGWLNEEESKGYNYICNAVVNTAGFAGDDAGSEFSYDIINVESEVKAVLSEKPVIRVSIELEYRIAAVKGELDVSKIENRKTINSFAEDKIRNMCEAAVSAAQNEFHSDIFGFGEEFHRSYPKYWRTAKDSWNEEFINLPVEVTVTAKLITIGEITKSLF